MSAPAFKGFASIVASLVTVIGATLNVPQGHRTYGLQVVLGGTVIATGCVVVLQASNDGGVTWGTIATWDVAAPLTSGAVVFAVDKPTAMLRANCTTLSGGTAPTVSAYISTV